MDVIEISDDIFEANLLHRRIGHLFANANLLIKLAVPYRFLQFLPPFYVIDIPCDRLAQTIIERVLWLPTQFLYFCTIQRITPIMSQAVCNMSNLIFAFSERLQNFLGEFDVWQLIAPANIIGLSCLTMLCSKEDTFTIIMNIDPIPHIQTISV